MENIPTPDTIYVKVEIIRRYPAPCEIKYGDSRHSTGKEMVKFEPQMTAIVKYEGDHNQ